MKILLTGSNGNLGSALQKLGRNHEWLPIGHIDNDWFRLPQMLEHAEVVIHACSDLKTPLWKDPSRVMDSNLGSTTQLLSNLVEKNIRFVFISSCAVYGRSQITQEDTVPTPISVNGITKLLNEKIVADFCSHRGIPFQILRLFNMFGGSDRFSILSQLRSAVDNSKPFTIYNGGLSQRDFIHVDDVAQLILTLLKHPIKHNVLNLGSGETVKISEIVSHFIRKHPALKVVTSTRDEAEYSRANIARLRSVFPDYRFRNVLDFIDQCL